MGKYDDIINMSHHVSKRHPQMSLEARSAQFAPFAALTGYEDAVSETGRLTSDKIELSEDERVILDRKLKIIQDNIAEEPSVFITYFIPDIFAEAKNLIKIYANSEDPIKIRDNAMLHIFLNCGLRLSEIKNLNLDDINLKDDRFTIIGKGNKERTNYLNDITKEALLKYLEIRDTSHDKARGNPLFLTAYGLRMSDKTIKMIVKRAYKKSGLDEKVYSVHTLRHTCATILYKAGCDIHTIQKLLGHVQIDTTEIYTHLHDQEVMDVMLNHPLAQYKMENALAYCA